MSENEYQETNDYIINDHIINYYIIYDYINKIKAYKGERFDITHNPAINKELNYIENIKTAEEFIKLEEDIDIQNIKVELKKIEFIDIFYMYYSDFILENKKLRINTYSYKFRLLYDRQFWCDKDHNLHHLFCNTTVTSPRVIVRLDKNIHDCFHSSILSLDKELRETDIERNNDKILEYINNLIYCEIKINEILYFQINYLNEILKIEQNKILIYIKTSIGEYFTHYEKEFLKDKIELTNKIYNLRKEFSITKELLVKQNRELTNREEDKLNNLKNDILTLKLNFKYLTIIAENKKEKNKLYNRYILNIKKIIEGYKYYIEISTLKIKFLYAFSSSIKTENISEKIIENNLEEKTKFVLLMHIKNNNRQAFDNLFYKHESNANLIFELLYYAINKDRMEFIKLLVSKIKFNEICNAKYSDGKTLIHLAIEKQNIELFNLIIDMPKVDYLDEKNEEKNIKSPFILALDKYNLTKDKVFIYMAKKIFIRLDFEKNKNYMEYIEKMLQDENFDPSFKETLIYIGLFYCSKEKNWKKFINLFNFIPNFTPNINLNKALHLNKKNPNEEIRIEINGIDEYRKTLLHYVIENKEQNLFDKLIYNMVNLELDAHNDFERMKSPFIFALDKYNSTKDKVFINMAETIYINLNYEEKKFYSETIAYGDYSFSESTKKTASLNRIYWAIDCGNYKNILKFAILNKTFGYNLYLDKKTIKITKKRNIKSFIILYLCFFNEENENLKKSLNEKIRSIEENILVFEMKELAETINEFDKQDMQNQHTQDQYTQNLYIQNIKNDLINLINEIEQIGEDNKEEIKNALI